MLLPSILKLQSFISIFVRKYSECDNLPLFFFQETMQKVCLLLKNLDQLSDLNIGFVYMFLNLVDICSN